MHEKIEQGNPQYKRQLVTSLTVTMSGQSTKDNPPPFFCGDPALLPGWPGGSALTSAVSVSAPPPPSPPVSFGSTSRNRQREKNDDLIRQYRIEGQNFYVFNQVGLS